jgi:hypothetical protein
MNHKPFPLTLAVALTVSAPAAFLGRPGRAAGPPDHAAAAPEPRWGHTMVAIGDTVYLFGGMVSTSTSALTARPARPLAFPRNDLWEWEVEKQDWEVAPPGEVVPPARFLHAATAYNDKMYVFGGVDLYNALLNDIWKYNPTTNEWEQQPSINPPPARAMHTAVTLGDLIYVFGGVNEANEPLGDLWEYNPTTGIWTRKADLPAGGL